MDSHDKIKFLNILELPTEILCDIVRFLQVPSSANRSKIGWGAETLNQYRAHAGYPSCCQDIRSARLVCRRFHDLTSPLLFPVLQIRLDRASLDFADHVSRSPFLAAGVGAIQVVLQYYSAELAADLSRFRDQRLEDAERWWASCVRNDELWDLGGFDSDDDTVLSLPRSEYRRGIEGYEKIQTAWRNSVKIDESLEYREILHRGHQVYRQKHQEQLSLLTDGFFTRRVASIMSQLPFPSSLILDDQADLIDIDCDEVKILLLTKKNELFRFATSPHQWQTIQRVDTINEVASKLAPAKLLSELPVAIHKAGVALRDIRAPCESRIWFTAPDLQDPLRAACDDLRPACQRLEVFTFGKPVRSTLVGPLTDGAKAHFDRYLGAMLSGPCLTHLELHLGWYSQHGRGVHHVGSMLGGLDGSRLKRTTVMDVSLHQAQLEAFCTGLGSELEKVYLCGVHLLSGRWAGVLDILRDKVSARCMEGKCKVYLRCLAGGEFGPKIRDCFLHSAVEDGNDLEYLSEHYVSGFEVMENPLRGSEYDILA
ncbi:hypothetical protein BJY01DRAFT_246706 [Aspergillus pseudoustus]|uniref:F-box domain-containing protein n=1 Tax=Aspergillus pseudoustus TaxID=1810923 RepID=A0ABR4K6F1_9EURO